MFSFVRPSLLRKVFVLELAGYEKHSGLILSFSWCVLVVSCERYYYQECLKNMEILSVVGKVATSAEYGISYDALSR